MVKCFQLSLKYQPQNSLKTIHTYLLPGIYWSHEYETMKSLTCEWQSCHRYFRSEHFIITFLQKFLSHWVFSSFSQSNDWCRSLWPMFKIQQQHFAKRVVYQYRKISDMPDKQNKTGHLFLPLFIYPRKKSFCLILPLHTRA